MPEENRRDLNMVLGTLKVKEAGMTVYRCPNGHVYLIGDCGRPYYTGKCNECNAVIGGSGHTASANNTLDSGTIDNSKKGHILGQASKRPTVSTPERTLSPSMCAIIRLLTHMSMLLGTKKNSQEVGQLVYPPVNGNVEQFLIQHIQKDIEVLQTTLNKSSDDIYLLIHFICQHVLRQLPSDVIAADMKLLANKDSRNGWEQNLSTHLQPVLQKMEDVLDKGNTDIVNDSNSGEDELLAILHEVESSNEIDIDNLHSNPNMWKYRERITVEHLLRKFQLEIIDKEKEKQSYQIIRLFKQELYHLKVHQFLPAIIKLQQTLMQAFCRKIDRSEALQLSIEDVFKKHFHDNLDIMEQFSHFVNAWELLKEKLISHVCVLHDRSRVVLPEDYHNVHINKASPLAMLLPSVKGPGLCSYILLEFLFRKHNECLQSVSLLKDQSYEDLPKVDSKDANSFHLITFHLQRDIQPLVLSNCNYSFLLGKGSEVSYDFQGFENQLLDRILTRKSRIVTDDYFIPIDTMLYKADSSNAVVFSSLRIKISQDSINPVLKQQICDELHKLTDICDSINNLDVANSFLKSLGGNPEASLHDFMSESLKMRSTIKSAMARSECKLKHLQSLWLILSFEKEKILTTRNKESFVDFDPELKIPLEISDEDYIKSECQKIPIDKLHVLLHFIYDCILLRIAQPKDEVDYNNMKLSELLLVELDSSFYTTNPKEIEQFNAEILTEWPETVLGSHAIQVWILLLKLYIKKDEEFL